jgi:chaperone modulatory protein CbpM
MQKEDMVSASEFCIHHNVEISFIHSLKEHGLIETVLEEENIFLPVSELARLEKIVRLHFELDINLEGIETIAHLLERMEGMQRQIVQLNNLLKAYERRGPDFD